MPTPLKRQIGYIRPKPVPAAKKKDTTVVVPGSGGVKVKHFVSSKKVDKYGSQEEEPMPVKTKVYKAAIMKQFPKEPATPKKLIAWIQDHPLFKWGAMCQQIGIDKANFARVMKSEEKLLRPEIALKIEGVLREYGFQ